MTVELQRSNPFGPPLAYEPYDYKILQLQCLYFRLALQQSISVELNKNENTIMFILKQISLALQLRISKGGMNFPKF